MVEMTKDANWRFAMAEKVATAYALDPNVEVILAGGSTGRGTADRYSDLEIDVCYAKEPTEAEREAAVAHL